ncbi:hypothetical protein Tco_1288096, partial [Tanacetum coccineum]
MLTLLAMFFLGVLYYGTYGVCIGILACRGLSLVSSPLHAMKSQTQIQSSAAVKFGGVTLDLALTWFYMLKRNFNKKESMKKAFQDMLQGLGEVNPTHAYYNGSCTSKDTEDPSWSTSFKTRSTQKTSSALEAIWKTLFVLYLYLIGT